MLVTVGGDVDDLDDLARVNRERLATAIPPPLSMPAGHHLERVWMVHDQGRQLGPHTEVELASLVAVGTISTTAMTWRTGSPRWIPITNIVPLPTYSSLTAHPRYHARDVRGSKIAAGILALLLGPLGVHKFVLGFPGAGMTMLLVSLMTCGYGSMIMWPIALIEGIIYLTKSDAQFQQDYGVERRSWF